MNRTPNAEQLSELLAQQDDAGAHHVLWIDVNGEVHLSALPKTQTPLGFEETQSDMRLRCESFGPGNAYTGRAAAADKDYVTSLFKRLVTC
ncbi:hypothetical protein FJY68_12875 [candidate division WOR-3 bacterium]|uniref:Uncharacterized protein n=1 Tax=candidate division WOR-3 bacterium TaxID=2052148 RepID=A0A937XGK4_UNCW3|nr:hypothetical protein [candidate division WOR-3 bacterium]